MKIAEKLRVGHVRRWHIVAVSREQTVADHMHRVVVLTEEILTLLGLFNWRQALTLDAMRWAHIHDRHEYLLGDIPTPGKRAIRTELYGTYGSDALDLTAAKIDPEADELKEGIVDGLAEAVVKYADTLEAMNYIGIFGCGSHARGVWLGLVEAAAEACREVAAKANADASQRAALFQLVEELNEAELK